LSLRTGRWFAGEPSSVGQGVGGPAGVIAAAVLIRVGEEELGACNLNASVNVRTARIHEAPRLVASTLTTAECDVVLAWGFPRLPCPQVGACRIQGLSMHTAHAAIVWRVKARETRLAGVVDAEAAL